MSFAAQLAEAASAQDKYLKQVVGMSEKEFAANPPPGFSYKVNARWSGHRKNRSHTVLGSSFFKNNPQSRTLMLYHEIGHDLMRDFNKNWKDVLEPFRLNPERPLDARSQYDNPFGMEGNPEEMVADVYAALFTGGEHWFESEKDKALFRQARKLAKKFGLPLP